MHTDELRTVAEFQLLRRIGKGGFGEVWRAFDTQVGREVALKQLLPSDGLPDARELARREANTLASVMSPHVPKVHRIVDDPSGVWLAMELVQGERLHDRALRGMGEDEVRSVGLAVASALKAAKQRHILHRDVKPKNIIVPADGPAALVDFGLARRIDEDRHSHGYPRFSPGYTAPEILRMEAPSHESDAWSLGASLYFALEQALPYPSRRPGEPWDSAMRPMQRGGALQPVIVGLLRDEPDHRMSVEEVVERLERRTLATAPTLASTVVDDRRTLPMPAVHGAPPAAPSGPPVAAAMTHPQTGAGTGGVVSAQQTGPATGWSAPSPQTGPGAGVAVASPHTAGSAGSSLTGHEAAVEVPSPATAPAKRRRKGRRFVFVLVALLVAAGGALGVMALANKDGLSQLLSSTTESRASTAFTDGEVRAFLDSYYSAAVGPAATRPWDTLSPELQQASGGRQDYDAWWNKVEAVDVNDVACVSADCDLADVSITYHLRESHKAVDGTIRVFLIRIDDRIVIRSVR